MQKPHILAFTKLYKDYVLELQDSYTIITKETSEESGTPEVIIDETLRDLEEKGIRIDGVIGDRDDTSILASLAAERLGLAGPSPESLYKTQHKGVFNEIAKKVNTSYPETFLITDSLPDESRLPFPGFLRPVKSLSSGYSYIVHNHSELHRYFTHAKNAHRPILPWYDAFFRAQHRDGNYIPVTSFLYQPFLYDDQYTVDAYIYKGVVQQLGITKSIYTPDRKSFLRFDFPSELSTKATKNLDQLLKDFVEAVGYDNGGFNVEFFINDDQEIIIIEFNSRIAGQFIPLMKERYSLSNYDIIMQLSMGKRPRYTSRAGKKIACSYPLRTRVDKKVLFVPETSFFEVLAKKLDVLRIRPTVQAGKKLSDYTNDAYSFRYAFVDIAGDSMIEIEDKLTAVKKHLGIVFEEV